MLPALDLALSTKETEGYLRQVVFLTDGAVGNEQELFQVIAARLGQTRLFTIGLGSAPNSHFMRTAAELGRGSFTYIGDLSEVETRTAALLRKLERPALTDLAAAFPPSAGNAVASFPAPLPDLYAGEPVSFTAQLPGVRLADLQGLLTLDGQRNGPSWRQRVPLDGLASRPGVAAVWARAKLAQIEDALAYGGDREQVRLAALDVALKYRLVTPYTSLVAIDDEVVRPDGESLESGEIARNLPDGWSYEHVFGAAGETMELKALPAPLIRQAAAGEQLASLPQTATPATLKALIGLGLVCLAAFLLLFARRLRRAVGLRAA
jgi:Ca-activated chloride channel family protein